MLLFIAVTLMAIYSTSASQTNFNLPQILIQPRWRPKLVALTCHRLPHASSKEIKTKIWWTNGRRKGSSCKALLNSTPIALSLRSLRHRDSTHCTATVANGRASQMVLILRKRPLANLRSSRLALPPWIKTRRARSMTPWMISKAMTRKTSFHLRVICLTLTTKWAILILRSSVSAAANSTLIRSIKRHLSQTATMFKWIMRVL